MRGCVVALDTLKHRILLGDSHYLATVVASGVLDTRIGLSVDLGVAS